MSAHSSPNLASSAIQIREGRAARRLGRIGQLLGRFTDCKRSSNNPARTSAYSRIPIDWRMRCSHCECARSSEVQKRQSADPLVSHGSDHRLGSRTERRTARHLVPVFPAVPESSRRGLSIQLPSLASRATCDARCRNWSARVARPGKRWCINLGVHFWNNVPIKFQTNTPTATSKSQARNATHGRLIGFN